MKNVLSYQATMGDLNGSFPRDLRDWSDKLTRWFAIWIEKRKNENQLKGNLKLVFPEHSQREIPY